MKEPFANLGLTEEEKAKALETSTAKLDRINRLNAGGGTDDEKSAWNKMVGNPNTVGTKKIQQYYSQSLPNAIYSQDPNVPLAAMTTTTDPRFTKTEPILKDPWVLAGLSGDLLTRRQAECEGVGAGDQFDHLNSLANGYDKRSRARCGWIYNNAKPSDGRGAFGTSDGAFNSTTQGTWMWNLEEARMKYHKSICDQVKNCEYLDAPQFKGRCGWCSTSGKAVPIVDGKVAYPLEPTLGCPASKVVTTGGSCPPPPPPLPPGVEPSPAQKMNPATVCTPLANGNLPRDCLIMTAKDAGCSESGTLINALKSGSDVNYFDTLKDAASYILYQQRAAVNLDETSLKSGKTTVAQALNEFKNVQNHASSNLEGGLQYAARDLCNKSGEMETFDFCTEILDNTYGPFGIDCLRKQFLRMGGQKTGTMYPGSSNMNAWNSNNTWADVKRLIQSLADATRSTDRATQEEAIAQFYGIPLEDKTRPAFGEVPGVEILWFTHNPGAGLGGPTVFLGRRIRNKVPMINQANDLKGVNSLTNVSMLFYTNIKSDKNKTIRVRVTSDDGFGIHLNGQVGVGYSQKYMNDANNLTALDYFTPTTFVTSKPWSLSASDNNIMQGYWFQSNNGLYFKMEMQDYTAGTPGIPEDCKCLGRPLHDMRFYTQAECASIGGVENPKGGNWYGPDGECLIGHGLNGSYTWNCKGLNNLKGQCVEASAGPWTEPPSSTLNLIQEPYAPMMSFQVYKAPQSFGADFNFADKRVGSLKMRWGPAVGTPVWVYKAGFGQSLPLGLPVVRFRSDTSISTIGAFKMYSFMTMTMLITFNSLPSSNNNQDIFWIGGAFNGTPGTTCIRLRGNGDNTASIGLYTDLNNPVTTKMATGVSIVPGKSYLIVVRILRANESDIYSVNGISLEAQEIRALRSDPTTLRGTGAINFQNPRAFSNPDGQEAFKLTAGHSDFDLSFVRLYDYNLDATGIKRETKNDWQYL